MHPMFGNRVFTARVSPDGQSVAAIVDEDTVGTLRVFDAGTQVERYRVPQDPRIQLLAFSPDSRSVLADKDRQTALVADVTTGAERFVLDNAPARSIASGNWAC